MSETPQEFLKRRMIDALEPARIVSRLAHLKDTDRSALMALIDQCEASITRIADLRIEDLYDNPVDNPDVRHLLFDLMSSTEKLLAMARSLREQMQITATEYEIRAVYRRSHSE